MHKIMIALIVVFLFSCTQRGVEITKLPEMEYFSTVGDEKLEFAFDMAKSSDGDVITVGTTNSNPALKTDFHVVKSSADGTIEWERNYGTEAQDYAKSVVTKDGGYVVAGYKEADRDGRFTIVLLALDDNGNEQWQKQYDSEFSRKGLLITRVDDGFIVAGETSENGGDAVLLKLSSDGSLLWQKTFGTAALEMVSDVCIDDTGILLLGSSVDMNTMVSRCFVARVDADGSLLWQKEIGEASVTGKAILANEDGYLLMGEIQNDFESPRDVVIMQISAEGTLLEQISHGGTGNEFVNSAIRGNNGETVIIGATESYKAQLVDVMLMILTDMHAEPVIKTFGGRDFDNGFAGVLQDNGHVTIAGNVVVSLENSQIFITELSN